MLSETGLVQFKADYDWRSAFNEACGVGFSLTDDDSSHIIDNVREVHFESDGENDSEEWLAIGKWSDGRYFVMSAWCDYTGWD